MNKILSMLVFLICTNLTIVFAQNTTLEVDNQYPGWLSSKIPFKDQESVKNLTVTGYINGTDVKFIRELLNNRQLSHLDLSDAHIVAGGDAYYSSYKIDEDNTIYPYMFTTRKLIYLSLPKSITKIINTYDRNYSNDLDTLVIGGELKLLQGYSVRPAKKYLMIREGVDSLSFSSNEGIQAKTVHLPSTVRYLSARTFEIDTVKVNIENIDYFENLCFYHGSCYLGVIDNDTITFSKNLLVWNTYAFRLKKGATIFLNDRLQSISLSASAYAGYNEIQGEGALSAKNLIIHSPSIKPIEVVGGRANTHNGLLTTATVYVPKGSAEAYKKQLPWSNATIIEEKVPVTGIKLDHENISFSEIVESVLLDATVLPEDADNKTIKWSSSNVNVATVDNYGMIICRGYGSAIITAKTEDGGFTAICYVISKRKEILPTSIVLDKSDVTIKVSEDTKLKADVRPADADNKNIVWSSNNEDIAKVSSDGTVTGIKAGTAIVYATAQANGIKAECSINVLQPVTGLDMDKASVSFANIGESIQLTATVSPEDASNKNVTWASSDTRVAIVSNGKVVCTGFGTAVISAISEDGGFMATCVINATTGINEITDGASHKVVKRYDATGREISQPVNGLNIIKTEDGRVRKTTISKK